MNRKIVALLIALVLCLSCVSAFATESKTTADMIVAANAENGTVEVAQPTAETKAILEEISALANTNTSVAEYFGIQDKEFAADLKVDELVPVVITLSAEKQGPVSFVLSTAASYTEEDKPVVMVGVMVDGELVWTELEYVIVDGQLVLTIPEDVAASMADGTANLAVLSDK